MHRKADKYFIFNLLKRTILVLLFVHSCSGMYAQKMQVFSGDTSKYATELSIFMRNVTDQHGQLLKEFLAGWGKDSLFNLEDKKQIMMLSRGMIEKNATASPHFVNLLSCMLAFKKYNSDPANYKNWIEGLKNVLDNRKTTATQINNVLEFTDVLLRENQIYHSGSAIWKARNKGYKILNHSALRVEFENIDLICYSQRDSIHIFGTNGIVYPIDNLWKGNGGMVTWERGGFSRDSVFAILQEYKIDLTRSEYSAEEVTFTNKFYFNKPLKGILTDKVKFLKEPDDATYPKFDSYTKEFKIPHLYQDIDYEGGLSMQGSKLVGTGTREKNAKLKIFRNDTLLLVASSVYFGFKSDRIASQRTSVTIRLDQDSIFHPDLFLTYRVRNRELTLLKTDNYTSQGPYFNSYHKVDMNFDQLSWRMDANVMKFSGSRGSSISRAYFESMNYFNYDKFMSMMMLDESHPLVLIRSFARKYGSEEFLVEDLANSLKMPINEVEQLAMRLANGGFIYYDMNSGMITIKQRLYDYLAASVNKIDYDVIGFSSQVEAPLENAYFNLNTYDLTINGIPQIFVSDSQNVLFVPRNNSIILKKNRNFQFDGVVVAGLLTFYGNNFFFNYDSFKVNLQNVDSMRIRYLSGKMDNNGFLIPENVENKLNGITGEVLIDHSDNKSGRVSYPEYPIFKSKENSYVYYDKGSRQNSVYESNDFYFEVYPFVMDSLDNFNYKNLFFKGKFVSAGIFPVFEQELSLQPDHSLGFRQMAPEQGYPVYGGKGNYFNEIWLSNRGLKGDGKLSYLTSTTLSSDFNFYPDSMNTDCNKFDIALKTTDTQYPMVRSVNDRIHWLPYVNILYANKIKTDFTLFNDSTRLNGNLKLEPVGLSGKGRMDLRNSELSSSLFTYKANEILSDTADFFLKSLYNNNYTVLSENVNSHISYSQQKGWFKSNEGFSLVSFPDNKYISYLDNFTWDMNEKVLIMGSGSVADTTMEGGEDVEPLGARYISVHPKQDSLNFVSPFASYDYKNNFLNASGVRFIEVADARIYPKEGKVTVESNARMKTLEDSKIIANKWTRHYLIHTASVNILGKKKYEGIGNYDYVDENKKIQQIHFAQIGVDTTLQTIASGTIFESSGFQLSPVYNYQGKVFMNARDSLLTFNGALRLEHNCDKLPPEWLYFQSKIDPENILIPVSEQPLSYNRNKIQAGVYLNYDSLHIYPSFFTRRKSYNDSALITANGFLYYDKNQLLFKIGPVEKIKDFTLPQDYMSFHREDCRLIGEGNIHLGTELGQVRLKAYGSVKQNIIPNETTLDLVMAIDFYLSEPMINLMAEEIDSIPNLSAVDINRPLLKKSMDAALGAESAQKLREELTLLGTIKELPAALKHTIVFNELNLKWNDETNSYQSFGKIGIGNINGVQINKRVNGFFEIQLKRSGDVMDFYLELDNHTYYYFGYTRGVMQTMSSNNKYNETIMNMKVRDRKQKVERNKTSYIYLISTDQKKNNFYRRYMNSKEENQNEEIP
jgi:hypothetical protein